MKKIYFIIFILVIISTSSSNLNAESFQNEFCKINQNYTKLSKKTNKSLKLQLYKRKRKKELSNLNYVFNNWEGKIVSIESVGDEFAYVSISVCKNLTIKTWNNEFSDLIDKTLIHIDSDIYETLLDLNKDDIVLVSGSFTKSDSDYFQESSITDAGSLKEPEYIVHFTQINVK